MTVDRNGQTSNLIPDCDSLAAVCTVRLKKRMGNGKHDALNFNYDNQSGLNAGSIRCKNQERDGGELKSLPAESS